MTGFLSSFASRFGLAGLRLAGTRLTRMRLAGMRLAALGLAGGCLLGGLCQCCGGLSHGRGAGDLCGSHFRRVGDQSGAQTCVWRSLARRSVFAARLALAGFTRMRVALSLAGLGLAVPFTLA